jgi:predicted PurR-regulated permease PerM
LAAKLVTSVNDFLSRDVADISSRLQSLLDRNLSGVGHRFGLETSDVRGHLNDLLSRIGGSIAGVAGGLAQALPGQIVNVFLFVLGLYYFLRDGEGFVRFLIRLSPFREMDTHELFASIQQTVHGAIVGQLATSAVQGGLTLVALLIFNVPGAVFFGALAMLLSVLPMIGTTPVTVGAALYLFASGRIGAAIAMAVSAFLIGLSDNLVRPYVQSTQTRMHPLLTLLSIFGGIELLGAAGVFLGPVIAAMAQWALDTYASLREKQADRTEPAPA